MVITWVTKITIIVIKAILIAHLQCARHFLRHFTSINTLKGRYCYFPHFIDEAEKISVAYPKVRLLTSGGTEFEYRQSDFRIPILISAT